MVLKGLSILFDQGVNLKNVLYDRAHLKSYSLPVRVISVGNISVGGTGKTSFVIWLLRHLSDRGLRVGVISRGYGGQVADAAQVPVGGDPNHFGDEPCLIANEKLGPVYVGPSRFEAGLELLKHHAVDLILADDAFQHRQLKRDVDVVLIDFSESAEHYRPLPLGRLRESFGSLERAQVIVSTKKSFSEGKDFSHIERGIPKGKLQLHMDYHLEAITDVDGNPSSSLDSPYLLVSGVAKPKGVEALARSKVTICEHIIFKDHYNYKTKDIRQILKMAESHKTRHILTTEKDAVKLRKFNDLRDLLYVMKLDYSIEGQLDEFFKIVIGKNR